MTLAVAIRISEFGESPERAIQGILAHKDRIAEVHFIHPTYREGDDLYPGWRDRDAPKLGRILIHFDATLNGANFGPEVTQVIEITADTELRLGAFERIATLCKSAPLEHNHIVLSTGASFAGVSPWYGFAVVMTVVDWIWNRLLGWNRLIQSTDVHVRFLMRKGKRAFLPEPTSGTTAPKEYGAHVARTQPPSVLWLLHNHAHMRLRLWWLLLFVPIWLFLALSWVSVVSGAIFTRSLVLGGWVGSAWILQSMGAHLICSHYLQIPYAWAYEMFFPAYFAVFPFYLMYSRLYIPQRK